MKSSRWYGWSIRASSESSWALVLCFAIMYCIPLKVLLQLLAPTKLILTLCKIVIIVLQAFLSWRSVGKPRESKTTFLTESKSVKLESPFPAPNQCYFWQYNFKMQEEGQNKGRQGLWWVQITIMRDGELFISPLLGHSPWWQRLAETGALNASTDASWGIFIRLRLLASLSSCCQS